MGKGTKERDTIYTKYKIDSNYKYKNKIKKI
ncbi:hypothetical protein LCGC14_1823220 [marine sediment metagenome]|uniref:Uncharacterized protein n=1 Tax=marine sediment metagenome TaxID=412755 RepID=A0A0F9GID1_9ZZZZ